MDLQALQAELRHFAAERDWESFHAPKNLAMALMVEAAELAELFQWTTLTESRALARDPGKKEQVADEIADVLLYLLQLADHTGIDVEAAVRAKLRKNAVKHPAKRGLPRPVRAFAPVPAPVAPPVQRVHLLVDWENVQPSGEALRALVRDATDIWLFHGPKQRVDDSGHRQVFGETQVTKVPRTGAGRNALDFQLSYYLGYISSRWPNGAFIVVSNDRGYDPMLAHASELLGFTARRCEVPRAAPAASARTGGSNVTPFPSMEPAAKAAPADCTLASGSTKALPRPEGGMQAAVVRKAGKQDMARVLAALQAFPESERPASRGGLLAFVGKVLGGETVHPERAIHALSQLQALRMVRVKADGVTYLPAAAPSPKKPGAEKRQDGSATGRKKAAPAAHAPAPGQVTAAQKKPAAPGHGDTPERLAGAVCASLAKMANNRPARPAALLRMLVSHAGKAPAPEAVAQAAYALLLARKVVVPSEDGKQLAYLR